MLKGQLLINGKDAYTEYGIFMDDTALSTLMTPAPNKEFISNKYRSKDGKSVIMHNPRLDEREITVSFNMSAKTPEAFLANYGKFCDEVLATGQVTIHTTFQPAVWYHCTYLSCTQFSEFMRELAKFSLKLNEPDPTDRGETSKYDKDDTDKAE
jgi:hypothetical protein|nr:MAG TPA: tail protein [Caudoviricetes sp.]DAP69149.1 MAG TPA: tail protein [Caudoviricetes sp.]